VHAARRCYLRDFDMRDDHMPARDAELDRARSLTRLLDDAILIPGTSFRVGLDPIVGLIPGVGDLVTGAMSIYLLTVAQRAGAPPSVLLRMVGNLAIDSVVGAVPFLGDLFDAGWKANRRNLNLIERYVALPSPTRRGSRLLVAAAILGVVALTVGALAVTIWLVRLLLSS
jgi:hypothetical protein